MLDSIVKVFESFNSDTLVHVKNLSLYIDYIDALKTLINFLGFMFKRISRNNFSVSDYFVQNFCIIFRTKIYIIMNLPQFGTQHIRKDLLTYIK